MFGWIVLGVVAIGLLYIRMAPTDVARWHQPIAAATNEDRPGGAVRVIEAGPETLSQLDTAMRALPRTEVLAGSVEQGRVTYVTRSVVFGFPDYTTIEQQDENVKLFARLRFGQSDMGVNRRRLEGLLAQLPQG